MQHDIETQEWLDALSSIVKHAGKERAADILNQLSRYAADEGVEVPSSVTTDYINTITPAHDIKRIGDTDLDRRIRSLVRWNALAMVMKANNNDDGLGGHIASYQSAAVLYEMGFQYFFHADSNDRLGDLIYYQGHSAPGIYARSYLEGRLTDEQLDNFRREVDGKGLSSYPHPWLMPDYWQFPTVSMGLGPITSIYQARFLHYLSQRGLLKNHKDRKVWAFLGDGECDEPETLGAISLAARERLDNLIFVVNCNLQRLDGPVRGNGKIIQELEGVFKGAGWNVIKVLWGTAWDDLLERDKSGLLVKVMNEVVDGELQACKVHGGAYTREHFFGKHPELLELVKDLTDEDIYRLNRGGNDSVKVYSAFAQATTHKGQPTVILAQTVKGFGMGDAGEAINETHSVKKLDSDSLKQFRNRFQLPFTDEELKKLPYYRPSEGSPEMVYLHQQRKKLGGYLPARRTAIEELEIPPLDSLKSQLGGTGDRQISTTMSFVRILSTLVKDKQMGKRIVPIVPDEARTFGMEGMFSQVGIYAAEGQKYIPHDAGQIMFYKEGERGQILEEGINEAGAMSSWIAAATSYSSNGLSMIPFYIYYSMFGFQRIGDLAWLAGDMQARGFLIGATAGRTTLNGEGLQHEDGHSHIMANTIPNCKSYDPTYNYELAVIIQHGMQRMYVDKDNCFYYITTMNENYQHPTMPEGIEEAIIKGLYKLQAGMSNKKNRVQLMGAGTILREVEAAADILRKEYKIEADVWSMTSVNELARDGQEVNRYNMMHPNATPKKPYITEQLEGSQGPVIAATDYMKMYVEQLRDFIPGSFTVLGTDGFGRSDSREQLRRFFEVNRYYVVIAALKALADEGAIKVSTVTKAIKDLGLDADKANPMSI
ncbi:pyruvate dehydrogenase (acetyl-transferring), homodimeric type [Candidatus Endobugula sertula]|uniref:Pyruvate dehydrogenase E1 component n=1 Tax=Candidatus Endobugula sertula TaxID=62101 RepID=A0A1D2QME9_9GAMM|nr:pyruvate dehydrogenase (acetyl-transferring), homodimeric type [Candidatus Endobugula sertula]